MAYMLESHLNKRKDRIYFNSLPSHAAVFDYLQDDMGLDLDHCGKAPSECMRVSLAQKPKLTAVKPPHYSC